MPNNHLIVSQFGKNILDTPSAFTDVDGLCHGSSFFSHAKGFLRTPKAVAKNIQSFALAFESNPAPSHQLYTKSSALNFYTILPPSKYIPNVPYLSPRKELSSPPNVWQTVCRRADAKLCKLHAEYATLTQAYLHKRRTQDL